MEIRGAALVTGATGGLGRAVARRLRGEGCSLTVTGLRGELVEAVAAEVDGRGVVADLADRDELVRVVDFAGDVDLLVLAAGVDGGGLLTDHSLDEVDRVLDVNLRVPLTLARLVGERMVARGSGHIVFVSSLGGKTVGPASSLHSAAWFGVRGFALALRQDWGPLGVGVSLVNVGAVSDAAAPDGVALPAGFQAKSPDDVAAAVVRAVRHDRAEVDVADPVRRAGVVFGQLAPQAAARLSRFAGSDAVGER
ncbi:SDR family NAD(P)-dependent oxidoreductase [Actinophytocola algeriensis]|uniref:Short-subunit dehydrogenase n=1 Tax=Actinophytocola algeriensis TaxID=1768010 RepID=A0A7W7VBY1_9PSEU|nr:SDR family oxidoreductase [Actinophytocola algeriensis]MBB4904603.1 short-subunit dehydrogenase [Actinophytocola algeriensis]MBE1476538.1 short-subunit dehydrogenase [Actinophytocola algeriensis]